MRAGAPLWLTMRIFTGVRWLDRSTGFAFQSSPSAEIRRPPTSSAAASGAPATVCAVGAGNILVWAHASSGTPSVENSMRNRRRSRAGLNLGGHEGSLAVRALSRSHPNPSRIDPRSSQFHRSSFVVLRAAQCMNVCVCTTHSNLRSARIGTASRSARMKLRVPRVLGSKIDRPLARRGRREAEPELASLGRRSDAGTSAVGIDDPLDRREAQPETDAAGLLAADIRLEQGGDVRVGWQSGAGVSHHGGHLVSVVGDVDRDPSFVDAVEVVEGVSNQVPEDDLQHPAGAADGERGLAANHDLDPHLLGPFLHDVGDLLGSLDGRGPYPGLGSGAGAGKLEEGIDDGDGPVES